MFEFEFGQSKTEDQKTDFATQDYMYTVHVLV